VHRARTDLSLILLFTTHFSLSPVPGLSVASPRASSSDASGVGHVAPSSGCAGAAPATNMPAECVRAAPDRRDGLQAKGSSSGCCTGGCRATSTRRGTSSEGVFFGQGVFSGLWTRGLRAPRALHQGGRRQARLRRAAWHRVRAERQPAGPSIWKVPSAECLICARHARPPLAPKTGSLEARRSRLPGAPVAGPDGAARAPAFAIGGILWGVPPMKEGVFSQTCPCELKWGGVPALEAAGGLLLTHALTHVGTPRSLSRIQGPAATLHSCAHAPQGMAAGMLPAPACLAPRTRSRTRSLAAAQRVCCAAAAPKVPLVRAYDRACRGTPRAGRRLLWRPYALSGARHALALTPPPCRLASPAQIKVCGVTRPEEALHVRAPPRLPRSPACRRSPAFPAWRCADGPPPAAARRLRARAPT
jgi:hypothetical protein